MWINSYKWVASNHNNTTLQGHPKWRVIVLNTQPFFEQPVPFWAVRKCMLHALPLHTRLKRECRDRYLRDSFPWGPRIKHSTEGTLPWRRLSDGFLQALDKIWAKIFKSDHDGSFPHTVGFSLSLGVLYKVTEGKHKTTWRVPNLDINYVPVTDFSNAFKEEWGAKLATERYVREERERERWTGTQSWQNRRKESNRCWEWQTEKMNRSTRIQKQDKKEGGERKSRTQRKGDDKHKHKDKRKQKREQKKGTGDAGHEK